MVPTATVNTAFRLEPKQAEQQKLIIDNQFVLAEGGSRCFVPSQEVVTENGPLPISRVTPGIRVETINEATGEREWKSVRQAHLFGKNQKRMVTIRLKNGQTIIGTEDHEIRFNGGWHTLRYVLEWMHGNVETNTGF